MAQRFSKRHRVSDDDVIQVPSPTHVGSPIKDYQSLPIFSVEHLRPGCGFSQDVKLGYDTFLRGHFQKIFERPGALADMSHRLFERLEPDWVDKTLEAVYKKAYAAQMGLGSVSDESPADAARIIDERSNPYLMNGDQAIIACVLAKISNTHPNMCFFRGANYKEGEGFSGADFSPGFLHQAIGYGHKSPFGRRDMPVLVALKFSDAARLFEDGALSFFTEDNWSRLSTEVRFDKRACANAFELYRLPGERQTSKILDSFEKTAVRF